jgi:hypothetical protein
VCRSKAAVVISAARGSSAQMLVAFAATKDARRTGRLTRACRTRIQGSEAAEVDNCTEQVRCWLHLND